MLYPRDMGAAAVQGTQALLARLRNSAGIRFKDGLRLRIKDKDYDLMAIGVCQA